jgi:hypothetical protein
MIGRLGKQGDVIVGLRLGFARRPAGRRGKQAQQQNQRQP